MFVVSREASKSNVFTLPSKSYESFLGDILSLDSPESVLEISSLCLDSVRQVALDNLPLESREALASFNKPGGPNYIHLKGLPIDLNLPSTPSNGIHPMYKKTWVSEFVLLGIIASISEAEPFSYIEQKQGVIVQEIIPLKGLEKTNSNASSALFGWHSDDPIFKRDYRTEGIALYCLRNEGKTKTWFAPAEEIVAAMSPQDVEILKQPRFRVSSSESFNLFYGQKIISEPRPLLTEGPTGWEFAVATYNTQLLDADDTKAKQSFWALQLALRPPVAKSVVLEPGDMFIFSNFGLHSRAAIYGDRWLQRSYFRGSLEKLRFATQSSSFCRVFSAEKLVHL